MRQIALLSGITALLFVTLGCGGGGGASTADKSVTSQVNFTAHTEATNWYGDLGLAAKSTTFSSNTAGTVSQITGTPSFGVPAAAVDGNLSVASSFELSLNNQLTDSLGAIYPAANSHPIVLVKSDGRFIAVPVDLSNGQIQTQLTNELVTTGSVTQTRAIGSVWQWLVGYVINTKDDTDLTMRSVANNSVGTDDTIVVGVHGIMCNYTDMTNLVTAFVDQLGCKNGYSLAYEWQDALENGTVDYLANWLAQRPKKKVILVGDSFGCLVARMALTNVNAQIAVKSLVLVAGPNEGSLWATPGKALYGLMTEWANAVYSGSCPFAECPAINAMIGSSQFLHNLNTTPVGQLPNIAYYLFAGDGGFGQIVGDGVVGRDSALAIDVNLSAFTTGGIYREVIPGTVHTTIFRSSSAIDQIVQFYKSHSALGNLSVMVGGQDGLTGPVNADPYTGSWYWQIVFTNNTGRLLTFNDLSLAGFIQNDDFGNGCWYDPTTADGVFYPAEYTRWSVNNTLSSGQSRALYIEMWSDSNKTPVWNQGNPLLKAFTIVPTVRYTVDGNKYSQELTHAVLHYGNIYPVGNVQTHAAHQNTANSSLAVGFGRRR